jgi:hypothetical protein
MAGSQITNPSGAFGVTSLDQKLWKSTGEFSASAAITAKSPVSISSTGTVATTATDGVAIIGVALNAASAAGKTVQVITSGIATGVRAGGATTLGTPVIRSATTAGAVTSSATPVTGTVVGFALGASSGGVSSIWVLPGTNTSS